MFPTFLTESGHHQKGTMTQMDTDQFSGFPMSKIESSFCPEGDGGDKRFWSIDQFVVRVPPEMVVAVAVKVDEHTIESVVGVRFASLSNCGECRRPGLCNTCLAGVRIALPGGVPCR